MEEKIKRAFKMAIEGLLDVEIDNNLYVVQFPRTLFASAVCLLKKGKKFSKEEYKEFMKLFMETLNERNVRVDNKAFLNFFKKEKKTKRRPHWVTDSMMAGAAQADFRHHQMLGDDY